MAERIEILVSDASDIVGVRVTPQSPEREALFTTFQAFREARDMGLQRQVAAETYIAKVRISPALTDAQKDEIATIIRRAGVGDTISFVSAPIIVVTEDAAKLPPVIIRFVDP